MANKVEVIIPNWNGSYWLKACLLSLQAQTFKDFQVTVVDNGSTDDSVEYVRNNFPNVVIIQLQENLGFPAGINAGIQVSQATYVCWLNNDTEVAPDFLEQLVTAVEAHPPSECYAMAAARVLFMATPDTINSAGIFIGADGLGRDRGYQQKDGAFFDWTGEVFGPAGVAALYRRTLFDEIGWLDEDFFLYSEDIDLNYRAQLAGYRCLYVPQARVYHQGSASARTISRRAARLASRNGLVALLKNLPSRVLLRQLPWIVIGQIYQLVLFARQGNLIAALAGKGDFCLVLPATLAKRSKIQLQRRIGVAQFSGQLRLGRTTPRLVQKLKEVLNVLVGKSSN